VACLVAGIIACSEEVRSWQPAEFSENYEGILYDYREVVRNNLESGDLGHEGLTHRTVMTAWDNTARRGPKADIAHGTTPELCGEWLEGILEQEMEDSPSSESLIFINAWNEGAEGAVLEPDQHFGRGFLKATRDAIAKTQHRYDSEDEE